MIQSYPGSVFPSSMKVDVKMPMCSSSNGTSSEVMDFRPIGHACKDQFKKKKGKSDMEILACVDFLWQGVEPT